MTNIMKKYENQIEIARTEIQSLMEKQNQIYQRLIDEICPNSEIEGWLWDYCFNCEKIITVPDSYRELVIEKIYGS